MADVSDPTPPGSSAASPHGRGERLDSWKAIAAYLGRDVTTVQRWEKREGLPVHRHLHHRLGSVYAYPGEIDAWLRGRANLAMPSGTTVPVLDEAAASSTPEMDEAHGQAGAVPAALGTPGAREDDGRRASARADWRRSRGARLRGRWGMTGLAAVCVAASVGGWWLVPRRSAPPPDPLDGARFERVTDFDGAEQPAAISRDGQFVAFVSDRDGRPDVWVTRIGSGQFHNLTRGRVRELINPDVRTVGFSPDGALVTFWARGVEGAAQDSIGVWAIPTLGGAPRPYLEGAAEYAWDARGERLVAHSPDAGDPTHVQRTTGRLVGVPIFTAPDGGHAHFPTWAADGRSLYVVLGTRPDALDVYRLRPYGGGLTRLTDHAARVTYPVVLGERTLLYLVSEEDDDGGTLHTLDLESGRGRPLTRGVERYRSLAASADGRRVVAALASTSRTLWHVPIGPAPQAPQEPRRLSLPTGTGWAPRHGPGFLLYVTAKGAGNALWKLVGDSASELWSDATARIVGGAAVTPDGRRLAFTVQEAQRTRLHVMNVDGTGATTRGDGLTLVGEPSWLPDGRSIVSGAVMSDTTQLLRLPVDGAPLPLVRAFGLNPTWSPDGRMVVYSGPDVGARFALAAAAPDGRPLPLPAISLPRGARRVRFAGTGDALIVMRGDFRRKELWLVDLASGAERQLVTFPDDFVIRDFDLTPDGAGVVVERVQAHADVVLIDLADRDATPR